MRRWGRSTQRQDGAAPTQDEERGETLAPGVREQALRGDADDELDAAIAGHVGENLELRVALDGLVAVAKDYLSDDGKKRRTAQLNELAARLVPAAMRGVIGGLFLIGVNALRARGVEYMDDLEQVSPRVERSTPFSGYRHALAAAFHAASRPERSPMPSPAVGRFQLPRGVVLGRIACSPTVSSSATRDMINTDAVDALYAMRSAVTPAELELVRLVDVGLIFDKAKRAKTSGRILREAIEPVELADAVKAMAGVPGAPRSTKDAAKMLRRAREKLREVLRERELIPPRKRRAPVERKGWSPFDQLEAGDGS